MAKLRIFLDQNKQSSMSSNTANIGVFWFISGRIVAFKEDADSGQIFDGNYHPRKNHSQQWDTVVSINPRLKELDYTSYPRGMVYRDSKNVFHIIGNIAILKKAKAINRIKEAFNLEGVQVVEDVKSDSLGHYDEDVDPSLIQKQVNLIK